MKRSFSPAQFSVGRPQSSVPGGAGGRISATSHTPHATRHSAGFTLIELLVVVAIIAILAGLTLSTLGYVNKKGAESRAKAEVAALSAAIDRYKFELGTYPPDDNLYRELVGLGELNTNKVFFEATPGIVVNDQFVEPWGEPYNYSTEPTHNVGFFDLWTEAGQPDDESQWIRN